MHNCKVRVDPSDEPFFSLHRHHTIVLRTRQRVSYHPLKATDHGRTMQLLFTQLLTKTSVIGRVKVKGKRLGGQSSEVGTLLLNSLPDFFSPPLTFFPPREKIQKRNSARKKKGPRARVNHSIPTSNRSMTELS
jgi:hypothetical protein